MNDVENQSPSDARSRAAASLLNSKRIGLESAIEALETVGYRVLVNERDRYEVIPPYAIYEAADDNPSLPLPAAQADFLESYPALLTAEHVAEIAGISPRSVYRLCNSNKLPCVRIGNSLRIPKKAFIAYLQNCG